MVTIVGPGGIGKTAVAKAAAASAAPRYPDGTRFVDLTLVDAATGVSESIATQLGYSSLGALFDAPGDHPVLIVVDNCEHVRDAAAEAIEDLIGMCEMPTILATSRSALGVAGEAVIPLGPLELPAIGSLDGPAIDLFIERARDAGAEVDATDSIAELVRRLDGVPLAIELAAARTRAMTADEVLSRLSEGIGVLDRPRRRSPQRHRSLRAAVDWSFHLLDDESQRLFINLSVFAGPFTADAAHAVAGVPGTDAAATQDRLHDLVDASMVVADTRGDTTQYRLLDTMRTVGRELLDTEHRRHAVETRFVDHVISQVDDIIERGAGTWDADALVDLRALYRDITTAVRWCVANDDEPDRALPFIAVLWGLVHQAHTEDIDRLATSVLVRWPDTDHPLRADAVATAATCRYMLGFHADAVDLATATLDAAERSPFAAATLRRAIAQSRRATGDTGAAREWFESAATEARRLGLTSMATEADSARAQILADLGHHDEAIELVESAAAEARAAGSDVGVAWATTIRGSILLRTDVDAATETIHTGLALSRELQYEAGVSVSLRNLALAHLYRGDVHAAATSARKLLDDLLARGSTYELRMVIDVASAILAAADRTGPADDLAATALSLPVVSITASVGHELFPLRPGDGTVLSSRTAIRFCRDELDGLIDGTMPARSAPSVATDELTGALRRTGDSWEIAFGDQTVTMRHSKGLADLATLLASPGREIHCLDLTGAGVAASDTGEVIDESARRAYEARVRDLQAEIDAADDANDQGRAEQARIELDTLVDHLTDALGLSGRVRTTGSTAERARSTVTQRIRSTIRRIEDLHPRLGRHLGASVRTGIYCVYSPELPTSWETAGDR